MYGKENKRQSNFKLPENFNGDLQSYISILYDHQKTCEKTGKYIEADMAKKKLIELRGELQKKTRQQMKGKHASEKSEVEKAHLEEFNEFNAYWDKKMQDYETEALRIQEETIQRHRQEMETFQTEIENSLGTRPKESSEIINLRKIEENLAKQENYQEAHKVQQKVMQLEREEYEKWSYVKTNKIKNLLQQLHIKQQNELSVLRKRIESGYEEEKQQRSLELEKLLQKYQNFMKELENQHHQEVAKFEKSIKLQSANSINISRMSNMSSALMNRN